jgi:alpha-tubulin suppressor-like RCC1 family protein
MAAIANGHIYTWGKGTNGQLGRLDSKNNIMPTKVSVPLDHNVSRVACGRAHTAFIVDGKLYTMGSGFDGALGHGNKDDVKEPKLVEGLRGVTMTDVSCGRNFTLCLSSKGDVYSMGQDDYGQCGVGRSARFQREPVLVKGLSDKNIVQVACGEYHAIALGADGKVYVWGRNLEGQLGTGDKSDVGVPKLLESVKDTKITQVACGNSHSAFLTDDGSLYLTGRGRSGQLGRGDHLESVAGYRLTPVEVDFFRTHNLKVVGVALGGDHSLALVQSK